LPPAQYLACQAAATCLLLYHCLCLLPSLCTSYLPLFSANIPLGPHLPILFCREEHCGRRTLGLLLPGGSGTACHCRGRLLLPQDLEEEDACRTAFTDLTGGHSACCKDTPPPGRAFSFDAEGGVQTTRGLEGPGRTYLGIPFCATCTFHLWDCRRTTCTVYRLPPHTLHQERRHLCLGPASTRAYLPYRRAWATTRTCLFKFLAGTLPLPAPPPPLGPACHVLLPASHCHYSPLLLPGISCSTCLRRDCQHLHLANALLARLRAFHLLRAHAAYSRATLRAPLPLRSRPLSCAPARLSHSLFSRLRSAFINALAPRLISHAPHLPRAPPARLRAHAGAAPLSLSAYAYHCARIAVFLATRAAALVCARTYITLRADLNAAALSPRLAFRYHMLYQRSYSARAGRRRSRATHGTHTQQRLMAAA